MRFAITVKIEGKKDPGYIQEVKLPGLGTAKLVHTRPHKGDVMLDGEKVGEFDTSGDYHGA